MTGALLVPENLTLADVWMGLHADAVSYESIPEGLRAQQRRNAIDENTQAVLRSLETCPVTRWHALIDALGVTQYGAIALSWCKGAALRDVVAAYETLSPDPAQLDRRALSLLAPQLQSRERRLSQLIAAADDDVGTLTLLALGGAQALIVDVPEEWLAQLPKALNALIVERAV